MSSCSDLRVDLLAYQRGDLEPLRKRRLEAHLQRCAKCARLNHRLGTALASARAQLLHPSAVEVEQLVHRVRPYLAPRNDRFPQVVGAAVAVAAAAMAAITMQGPELRRFSPQPGVRVVAQGDLAWPKGRQGGLLESGWLVVDSTRGGIVWAGPVRLKPSGRGARFWVEREGKQLSFGVERGTIQVRAFGSVETMESGTNWRVANRALAPLVTSRPVGLVASLSDPYLPPESIPSVSRARRPSPKLVAGPPGRPRGARPIHRRPARSPRPVPVGRSLSLSVPAEPTVAPEVEESSPSWEDLEWHRAEQLVRQERWRLAEQVFGKLERRHVGTLRRIARLERARLLGLHMDSPAASQKLIESLLLEGTRDEVERQALLTRCELLRDGSTCLAKACLEALAASEVAKDAERTLQRWKLNKLTCPNKK